MEQRNSSHKVKHTCLEITAVGIAVLAFLAAAWQGYIANDSEKRQLRAYVGVHQASNQGLEDSATIGVGFHFINHGQTPAQKFNFIGVIDILPYPLPQGYVLAEAPARQPQNSVVFPNEKPALQGWAWERDKIDAPTKKEIISANPKREIYAHGIATYDDIFGAHWRTEFCFFLNPSSLVRDANGNIVRDKDGHMQYQWAPCTGYNKVY
jgi:hypothetical protein